MEQYKILIPKTVDILILNKNYLTRLLLKNKKTNFIVMLYIGRNLKLYIKGNYLFFNSLKNNILYKTWYKIILNQIEDIVFNFEETLFIKGAGFKVRFSKNKRFLLFLLGFSHIIFYRIPFNIRIKKIDNKGISISFLSKNRQFLYEFISILKTFKKTNIYKGKGLFISKDIIVLKKPKILEKK